MSAAIPLRRFEEAGFNAWPALQTILVDGWVVRLAEGYTKRANSANPTYPSAGGDVLANVERCERIYRERGLPPIVRLTSFGCPPGLDELLSERGYRHLDPTLVMSRSLSGQLPEPRVPGEVIELPLDDWLQHYVVASGAALERQATHAAMLRLIGAGARYCAFVPTGERESAACGLAVIDGGLVGLFDIVTARERRNRGYGGALVTGMLRLAAANGASTAYLQVMSANDAACRLYRALGFTTAYDYWYRIGAS